MSQTNHLELGCLSRHASGRARAVEIGTHMGVSAGVIASVLGSGARLICVDPWPRRRFMENPSYRICVRELERLGVRDRVEMVRMESRHARSSLPPLVDFMFIDGDHSRDAFAADWRLACDLLVPGGIVCLHDTSVPHAEPWRVCDSVHYFDEAIRTNADFAVIETCWSMNVLVRVR